MLQLFEAAAGRLERAGTRTGPHRGDGLRLAALRVVLLNRVDDRDFRRDDRLDVVAGHELDVVHREDVRRVRHRDRQRRAGAAERDDLIFLRGFGGNQLDDSRIDFKLGQVDRRNAVLAAEERR